MDNVPDLIKEMTQGHDYEMQSKEERATFNSLMKSNGWNPIWDTLGIIYRWWHSETGRLINDTVAFNGWLPNYQLPQSEKPI